MQNTIRAGTERLLRWFETRIDPFPGEIPSQPPAQLSAFVWYFLRPVAWSFALLTAITLVMATIEVVTMAFVGRIIDMMKDAPSPATFWQLHGHELLIMAVVTALVRPLMSLAADLVKQQMIVAPVQGRIRWLAHRYVLRQSLGFFQNDFGGRLATRVVQLGNAIRDATANVCDIVVWVVVHWIGTVVLFAIADWRLTIPLMIWLGGYIIALRHFVPRIEKLSHAASESRSALMGRIVDSYTNMMTVKLFAHAEREDLFAKEAIAENVRAFQEQTRLNTLMEVSLWALNGLVLVATTGLALWLWTYGLVTVGSIAIVTTLMIRLINMSGWFMWTLAGIFDNIGVIQESMDTIAKPYLLVDAPGAKPLAVTGGEIRFEAVTFRYASGRTDATRTKGVLDNLSLRIAPGEKVGLVGRSGAGKSTLVSALLRFYDLDAGRILIDGQDVAKVTQDSLRAHIGVVTQDTSLLHRSVLDNIRYGRPDASEADAIAAARRAQAHEFIVSLVDGKGRTGYGGHVGERGVKLSGGQRQRIAIARVLLKDAPILILDEATSALDSEAEAAIQDQLDTLMAGKTVIAIAHRLSTIAAMDRLIIMDKGRIVEDGSHTELLARGGLYASLWARQSGGFLAREDDGASQDQAAAE
jgi:ATP-binding cassette, subfamily B, multidrug efflux pump